MNKKELIAEVAKKAGISKANAGKALDAFTEVVTDVLKEGEKVQVTGFGTFEVSDHAGRIGRNPQTGESIEIPASKLPKFKAGKILKEAVKD